MLPTEKSQEEFLADAPIFQLKSSTRVLVQIGAIGYWQPNFAGTPDFNALSTGVYAYKSFGSYKSMKVAVGIKATLFELYEVRHEPNGYGQTSVVLKDSPIIDTVNYYVIVESVSTVANRRAVVSGHLPDLSSDSAPAGTASVVPAVLWILLGVVLVVITIWIIRRRLPKGIPVMSSSGPKRQDTDPDGEAMDHVLTA